MRGESEACPLSNLLFLSRCEEARSLNDQVHQVANAAPFAIQTMCAFEAASGT
jgi:hypothetical protein